MKAQTKFMSMVESWANVVIGVGIQMAANFIILPWFGFHPSMGDVLGIAAIMTVISVARSYVMRRVFELFRTRNTPPFFESVIAEIAAERLRQINAEGYSVSHDDEHVEGEIAAAGAAYALAASMTRVERQAVLAPLPAIDAADLTRKASMVNRIWPWGWHFFKLTTRRRDLIKAAALIVAEIGRLDRKATR